MSSWASEYGYELIEADRKLAFQPPNPQLAQIEQAALADARTRYAWFATTDTAKEEERPHARPVYRASRNGGGIVREGEASLADVDGGSSGGSTGGASGGSGTGSSGFGNPGNGFGAREPAVATPGAAQATARQEPAAVDRQPAAAQEPPRTVWRWPAGLAVERPTFPATAISACQAAARRADWVMAPDTGRPARRAVWPAELEPAPATAPALTWEAV